MLLPVVSINILPNNPFQQLRSSYFYILEISKKYHRIINVFSWNNISVWPPMAMRHNNQLFYLKNKTKQKTSSQVISAKTATHYWCKIHNTTVHIRHPAKNTVRAQLLLQPLSKIIGYKLIILHQVFTAMEDWSKPDVWVSKSNIPAQHATGVRG